MKYRWAKKLQLQLKTSKTNAYQRRYDLFRWKVIKLPFVWMRMNYCRFFQSATGEVTSQNFYFWYFIYSIYDCDPYYMDHITWTTHLFWSDAAKKKIIFWQFNEFRSLMVKYFRQKMTNNEIDLNWTCQNSPSEAIDHFIFSSLCSSM